MNLHARLALLLLCSSLNGCFLFEPIVTLPRDLAILSDHARLEAALARSDVPAAEDFLTGERFTHRSQEVVGASWAELAAQAAKVLLAANARGQTVKPEALYQAHIIASYSHDLPVALEQLQKAQQLLDSYGLSQPEYKRDQIFSHRFTKLVLYRYLESGGRIDWYSEIGLGLRFLRFPGESLRPGEPDPSDFYRFPTYLTLADREWLFSRVQLDEAIWRDNARLHAFTRSQAYYEWYDAYDFDWLLTSALNEFQGPEQVCLARKRGYDVIGRTEWNHWGEVDPQTCRMRDGHY
ncbi:hypothetical protein [Aquipseudomonas alcaligenes]|uniref:Lipoprotein n=1 Tax=Aquipseudomonas alcaligenes TaxID=43263 RepID=A0AA37CK60_AQUAC|nr:hypothetical protein [Pseudomonas alcaligenes]BCR26537.1 hypothetical protein KAM426_40640 [Pseudomonas alcaligenes]GIZ69183.1 hypothetical protein KAM428_42680 [Pseudomonas alcaligenes]GIZ73548.1 hypothetical protein KAM429_43090 [Pseudomonas alcaligenes]GIZ77910.1 hypothetical protein KAM430_43190 [Pseudomonas alcaligenes]GIZ82275.1 hypothetical protein KAM432_43230 [Pseudomonas alcaligenes]